MIPISEEDLDQKIIAEAIRISSSIGEIAGIISLGLGVFVICGVYLNHRKNFIGYDLFFSRVLWELNQFIPRELSEFGTNEIGMMPIYLKKGSFKDAYLIASAFLEPKKQNLSLRQAETIKLNLELYLGVMLNLNSNGYPKKIID